MMAPVDIPAAATVLLLRESSQEGLQVLLTKRAAGLSFMAGLWVFPGGRMEAADLAPALADRVDPGAIAATATQMLDAAGEPVAAATARGLLIAACRETFEESGVLLARNGDGSPGVEPGRLARLSARRAEAARDPLLFAQLLTQENLTLDLERLVYWAHWITPSLEKKRFDTRFFALTVPPDQDASVDLGELTHHAWLNEQDILRHTASGEMRIAPPTSVTLQDLWRSHARHGSLAAMLAAERGRSVPPILPKMIVSGEATEIVLPWDPGYGQTAGEGCRVLAKYPAYIVSVPSRMRITRVT
jgi:8-oxo-dGTP pyrophosphatase MutT (NUDIX family)